MDGAKIEGFDASPDIDQTEEDNSEAELSLDILKTIASQGYSWLKLNPVGHHKMEISRYLSKQNVTVPEGQMEDLETIFEGVKNKKPLMKRDRLAYIAEEMVLILAQSPGEDR